MSDGRAEKVFMMSGSRVSAATGRVARPDSDRRGFLAEIARGVNRESAGFLPFRPIGCDLGITIPHSRAGAIASITPVIFSTA